MPRPTFISGPQDAWFFFGLRVLPPVEFIHVAMA
jgi:hypothetical protein